MKRLIIEIQKGGLGDHLFYSHLPRIAKQSGKYTEVFISNRSIFRNADYKKLIWELNPFVDGFTDEEGLFFYPDRIGSNENLLDKMMLLYGLDDGKRFHEPEIYYQPEYKTSLQEYNLYDPNYVSYIGDLRNSQPLEDWLQQNNVSIDFQMKDLKARHLNIACEQRIETISLMEFCSVIKSCKNLYCLTSGTATLAAALQKPATVFFGSGQNTIYHHSAMHTYVDLGSNYNWPHKLKKQIKLFLHTFIKTGTP